MSNQTIPPITTNMQSAKTTLSKSKIPWVYRWLLRILLLWCLAGAFLCLFAPLWTGLWWHELLGIITLILALAHLKLNWWFFAHVKTWFKRLIANNQGMENERSSTMLLVRTQDCSFKTRAVCLLRVFGIKFNELLRSSIGIGLICSLTLTLITGVVTSQEIFAFIPWQRLGGTFNDIGWRSLHMMFAYYVLLFVSLHAGLHLHTLFAFLPAKLSISVKVALLIIAVHGAQVWLEGDYVAFLLGQQMFSFWDFDANIVWFFTDKLAIVTLWAMAVYLVQSFSFRLARL